MNNYLFIVVIHKNYPHCGKELHKGVENFFIIYI